ncbi:MAG: cation-translocating P-type ATPase, partial [Phycisphaerales bacterium]
MPPSAPGSEIPSPPAELRLRVTGMHCAGCAANVQKAIESQPGVSTASVSVIEGLATVNGTAMNTEGLIRAIRARGFGARAIEGLPAPAQLRSEIELRQTLSERQWRYRAVIGLGIWIPMEAFHWIAQTLQWHVPWMPWVMAVGATIVLASAGLGFYQSAIKAALRRTTNMDTLIAIGATTAYVFSLVVLIAQHFDSLLTQQLYFAESAALLGIISLGHWLEARATAKAGSAVRELLELQPDEAEIADRDGATRFIPSAEVSPGDRVVIRPGSRVPVDGLVVDGESDIDESVVSGESLPVRKFARDEVVSGSMNTTGWLMVEATVDGRHTTVARIAELVQRAQASKADIQRLADRVCAVFVPAVLTIALLTVLGWWFIGGDLGRGVIATVTVLIISCPCALGLATPMAV